MQHFLIKLNPPRPTFAQDMNEEEKKLMHEHAAYWKKLQENGSALVYGPVLELMGAWIRNY